MHPCTLSTRSHACRTEGRSWVAPPANAHVYPMASIERVGLVTSDDAASAMLGVAVGLVVCGVAAGALGIMAAGGGH